MNQLSKPQTRFQKIETKNLIQLSDASSIPIKNSLSVGLHIIHEVTSAQAFSALKKMGLKVKRPKNTFAVTDHVANTGGSSSKNDLMDEILIKTLEDNCKEQDILHYGIHNQLQGVCHVVAPEVGLTQPNITIFCGDSHTSTHGAFGTIAAGIGTSNVRDIFATGCLLNYTSPKQIKIEVNGKLKPHITAKDLILFLLAELGNEWATGGAVFFTGSTIAGFNMEERMTICNMTIEMGGRFGYCDVDEKTIDWYRQKRDLWNPKDLTPALIEEWKSFNTDEDAVFDKTITFEATKIDQMVSYGLSLNDIARVTDAVGKVNNVMEARKKYEVPEGEQIEGVSINGAFIGSCTNGRYLDFKAASEVIKSHGGKIKVKTALAVPGSTQVKQRCEEEGLHQIFIDAGFEWREPGCSSCLAMNPDKFVGRVASSTNRNFPGRQGPESRTYLMSPTAVALSALEGKIANLTKFYENK